MHHEAEGEACHARSGSLDLIRVIVGRAGPEGEGVPTPWNSLDLMEQSLPLERHYDMLIPM